MPKRNSIFSHVYKEKVPQSMHNLSYSNRGTLDAGKLTPVFIKPTIPGDVWYGGTSCFLRTQPMVNPLMTNINIEMRYFWVPNRMVWHDWKNWLLDQDPTKKYDGNNPFSGHFPTIEQQALTSQTINDFCKIGGLADWMGVPYNYKSFFSGDPDLPEAPSINALPFRAYWLIWNEYFRDENLQSPVNFNFNDGNEDVTEYQDADGNYVKCELLNVCWKKDRFTSALPFPQKGEDVELDNIVRLLTPDQVSSHPNIGNYVLDPETGQYVFSKLRGASSTGANIMGASLDAFYEDDDTADGNLRSRTSLNYTASFGDTAAVRTSHEHSTNPLDIDPNGTLSAQMSIRRLRQASAIQRILEKKALAGSRYAEYILSMYGVQIPDSEIGRPVYLGGGSNPVNISPVEQMSSSDATSPQGNLAGKGVGAGGFSLNRPYMFNDFGYIIGVAYIRPEAEYYQGLKRDLWMNEREDYYNPDYQLLGEEEIAAGEVCLNVNQDPRDTFGYQQRYAYLKTSENEIHGHLKSDMITWVQPRILDVQDAIALNGNFVSCNPYEANNFAVDGYPHYICEFYNSFNARRPMYFVPYLKNGQL